MIMNAIVAVALGLAPMNPALHGQVVRVSSDEYTGLIGRYYQSTDGSGTTHLKGIDRRNGRPFDIAVASNGQVEGTVGEMYVTFNVKQAA